jgi:hypothetical protein
VAAVDRAIKVLAAINQVASAEGVPVAIHHVCVACAAAVQASGVGLYVLGDLGLCEPLYVTNSLSELVAELQVTLGEGPGTDALGHDHPVLVPTLGSNTSVLRWPSFAPAALAAGVSAVFAFALVMGAISVGALEIHRDQEGKLSTAELGRGVAIRRRGPATGPRSSVGIRHRRRAAAARQRVRIPLGRGPPGHRHDLGAARPRPHRGVYAVT